MQITKIEELIEKVPELDFSVQGFLDYNYSSDLSNIFTNVKTNYDGLYLIREDEFEYYFEQFLYDFIETAECSIEDMLESFANNVVFDPKLSTQLYEYCFNNSKNRTILRSYLQDYVQIKY